jgi:hypothetical protein
VCHACVRHSMNALNAFGLFARELEGITTA